MAHFQANPKNFQNRFVNQNESKQWKLTAFPIPKKSKQATSFDKIMDSVFYFAMFSFVFFLCVCVCALVGWLVGWLVGFYGISTFVGYLTPNPFLCKKFYFKQFSFQTVLIQLIQFSISTDFVSTQLNAKIVLY